MSEIIIRAAASDPRLREFAALTNAYHAALAAEGKSAADEGSEEHTLLAKCLRDADAAIDAVAASLDPTSPKNLGVRAKVAEWLFARYDDELQYDPWVYDLIQTTLAVTGIEPLKESPFRQGYDDPRIKICRS